MIDLDELRAEIGQFKTEAMKMHIVQFWAESYQNSNPFGHIVDDQGVFWIKAQAYQLWKFWQSAKQSKQTEINTLQAKIEQLKSANIDLQQKLQYTDTQLSDVDNHYILAKREIEQLKEKFAKVESGDYVIVPKSEISNYYYDDCQGMYINEPDSFLTYLNNGEIQEVKRRDYFDLPSQYAANVYIDLDNIQWELFDSQEEAEKAAAHCKAMIQASEVSKND